MRSGVFLFGLIAVYSTSALGTQNSLWGRCRELFLVIGARGGELKHNSYEWTKDKINDPRRISPKEYEYLRSRKVSDYFKDGEEITQEAVDNFYKDFDKVAANFGRMQLGDSFYFTKRLPKEKEREEHWKIIRDEVMKYGFVQVKKDTTLEQLLLDQHFEQSRPPEKKPIRLRLKQFGYEAPWIPVLVAKKSAVFILGESKWAFRTAVLGSTLSVMLGLFTNPINDNIAIFMNDNFGHIGTRMQLWFADTAKARDALNQMVAIKDEMKAVDRRYQMNEISEGEAKKIWRKLEETFLRYVQEMNSVVPDNVARGRVYFRDGNIINPLTFVTATSSVQAEILAHESAIRDYERIERTEGGLNAEQREKLKTEKIRLEISQRRMGAVLASIRVHEMIYPEFTRNKFQKEKSTNDFFQSYKVLLGGMHLEDYSRAYLEQMESVLKDLGVQLNRFEKHEPKKNAQKWGG